MANTMAAFYGIPPWFEDMQRLQRKWGSVLKPLTTLQVNNNMLNNIAASFDNSAIREMSILAQQCTPGMWKMVQQEQELLAKFAPLTKLQTQVVTQIPHWTQSAINTASFRYDTLLAAKNLELSRWAEAAERITSTTAAVENIPGEIDELPEEDQQAIAAEVTAIFADSENWEQRFMARVAEVEKTHPFWAAVIKIIVFNIVLAIIVNLTSNGIGQAICAAKVYQQPDTSSQVVYYIEPHQTVIVVGEVPYYYEIEVKDEDTDQAKKGYVSKRSIRIEDNTENIPEAAMEE